MAGNATASRELYREAFAAYVSHQGDIKVSKDQLGEILVLPGLVHKARRLSWPTRHLPGEGRPRLT